MLETFANRFGIRAGRSMPTGYSFEGINGFLQELGGQEFGDGLYRIHTSESAKIASSLVADAFPAFKERIHCFGQDWIGRQFSTDSRRGPADDPMVLMYDVDMWQVLEIPCSFTSVHDEEFVQNPDAALAYETYQDWRGAGGATPRLNECVGFKIPLFLGGEDIINNMEIQDLDVYWSINTQLRGQIL